jgi:Bromodomain extra-terminal - transcription regulation
MNRNQKDQLREQIDRLDPEEHAQIFEIVKKYTENYTKTQTGVMVSSDNLPNECLKEMEAMVHFYRDQRKRMEADAQERKTIQTR